MQSSILFLLLLTLAFISPTHSAAQNLDCGSALSKAEQDFISGQFDAIQTTLCECLDIHKKERKDTIIIAQKRYRRLIGGLKYFEDRDTSGQLGNYSNFSDALYRSSREVTKKDNFPNFTTEQRYRAYSLLGKVYYKLGAYSLAEFMASRIVSEHPTEKLPEDEYPGFKRIYDNVYSNTKRFSAGLFIGWQYIFPRQTKENFNNNLKFKHQAAGNILLGAKFNYILNDQWMLSFIAMGNRNEIEYRIFNPESDNIDLFFNEEQLWLKFPIMATWSPESWRITADDLFMNFFLRSGISLNYIDLAKAVIYSSSNDQLVPDYSVRPSRNKFNSEVIAGAGVGVRLRRNNLTLSVNSTYTLMDIVNKEKANSTESAFYKDFGVREINYRLATFNYLITYNILFNQIKGIKKF